MAKSHSDQKAIPKKETLEVALNTFPINAKLRTEADNIIRRGVPAPEVENFLVKIMLNETAPIAVAAQLEKTLEHSIDQLETESVTQQMEFNPDDYFNITFPNGTGLNWWQSTLFLNALQTVPITAAFGMLLWPAIALANKHQVTIGIGNQIAAGAGGGFSLGAGLLVAPGGVLGVYGGAAVNIGWFAGISATLAVTTIFGGIKDFEGDSVGVTFGKGLGKGIVGSVTTIFYSEEEIKAGNVKPFGFIIEVGLGLGVQGFSKIETMTSLIKTEVPWLEAIERLEDKHN